MLDDKILNEKLKATTPISVGVTWIDGRALFRDDKKWSKAWYGICHFSKRVFSITPLDWERATMVATILVSPKENYCEKAFVCLNFGCPLSRFDKTIFVKEFDTGPFTLGLPKDFGTEQLWINKYPYINFFSKFILGVEGGRIEYNEEKLKNKE